MRTGLDDAGDGDTDVVADVGECECGGGVACDDEAVRAVVFEEASAFDGVAGDGGLGFRSVGKAGGVAEIDVVGAGDEWKKGPEDGEAAEAGVEDADGCHCVDFTIASCGCGGSEAVPDVIALRAFGMNFSLASSRVVRGGAVLVLWPMCAAMSLHGQAASGGGVVVQPGAPGMPSKVLPPSTRPLKPQRSQADVDFMQGMIMHHSQAVEMTALIPTHTENKQVRLLGEKISSSQSDEMQFMKRWLAARGEATSMPMPQAMPGMPEMDMAGKPMPTMPGMLTPAQMDALRKARGAEFDRLFLTGMIQHHNGALVMVKDLFNTAGAGQDADLFNFATDADNTQRAEIRIMENMLKEMQ